MITRRPFAQTALQFSSTMFKLQTRCLHANMAAKPIPSPTPFVPDPQTFLTLIGRNMSAHAAKIPSWEALFSLSSAQLRDSGVEPARSRRYLLHWREKFRNGEFGIGGDLTEVQDGVGELRIIEVPVKKAQGGEQSGGGEGAQRKATLTSSPGMRKMVVNVPAGQDKPTGKPKPISMVKIVRSAVIAGPMIEHLKGVPNGAKIVAKEGLWEQKRGHKVDGGERRKAEVRSKRRAEERKTTRG